MNTKEYNDDFLNSLDGKLGSIPEELPSAQGKQRFLDFIENEEQKTQSEVHTPKVISLNKWIPQIGAAAAVIAVLVMVFLSQNRRNHQLEDSLIAMNNKIEQLLQNDSPTERIKAITVGYELGGTVNDKMLETLIDVLRNDESSNVRQTAVETLAFYINNEYVRGSLIQALQHEKDAGVKLSIIQAIGRKIDDKSKNVLKTIVENDKLEPFVIDEANMQLIRFNQY